jgi:hypothetical protein
LLLAARAAGGAARRRRLPGARRGRGATPGCRSLRCRCRARPLQGLIACCRALCTQCCRGAGAAPWCRPIAHSPVRSARPQAVAGQDRRISIISITSAEVVTLLPGRRPPPPLLAPQASGVLCQARGQPVHKVPFPPSPSLLLGPCPRASPAPWRATRAPHPPPQEGGPLPTTVAGPPWPGSQACSCQSPAVTHCAATPQRLALTQTDRASPRRRPRHRHRRAGQRRRPAGPAALALG